MKCLRSLLSLHYLSCLTLVISFVVLGCDRQEATAPAVTETGGVRTFTGKWTATGNRQTMKLGSDNEAIIFRLTGSLLLAGKDRPNRGFKADTIGFSDTRNGLLGRTVWTDENGDKVFSELNAEPGEAGRLIEGKFMGGTGPYTGVNGEYTFRWKRLVNNENGEISGRTDDLKGWVRLGAADAEPATIGDQQ